MPTAAVVCMFALLALAALPFAFFKPGRFNPQWWRTAIPFFTTGVLLLLNLVGIFQPVVTPDSRAGLILSWAAVILGCGAILLIGFTVGTHREPVSMWHQEDQSSRRLVTWGAYARVRHPFYLAFIIMLTACLCAVPHWATLLILVESTLQLNRTAAREEARMIGSELGAEYRAYMRQAGRFLPARL